jgi:hypothetical protein
MLPVGPLPQFWTIECDRFVCRLDAEDVPLSRIVALVKKEFQPLKLVMLTPGMVDKRLRMLDQDVSIDYWKDGLREEGNEMMPSNGKSPGAGQCGCSKDNGKYWFEDQRGQRRNSSQ